LVPLQSRPMPRIPISLRTSPMHCIPPLHHRTLGTLDRTFTTPGTLDGRPRLRSATSYPTQFLQHFPTCHPYCTRGGGRLRSAPTSSASSYSPTHDTDVTSQAWISLQHTSWSSAPAPCLALPPGFNAIRDLIRLTDITRLTSTLSLPSELPHQAISATNNTALSDGNYLRSQPHPVCGLSRLALHQCLLSQTHSPGIAYLTRGGGRLTISTAEDMASILLDTQA